MGPLEDAYIMRVKLLRMGSVPHEKDSYENSTLYYRCEHSEKTLAMKKDIK